MSNVRYILLVFLSIALFACKQNKELTRTRKLPAKKPDVLVENMQKQEFTPRWFSAKASVAFKTEKLDDSFKMNIRMRKDSLIWVSTTYYAVEVARFLITPDSVKYMDRKNKQFFVGKFDYLGKKFNVDLSFSTLQSIILGNSVGISDSSKIDAYSEEGMYVLSTFKKRKVRKATDQKPDKDRRTEKLNEIAYMNWLHPETFKLKKLAINDFKLKKSLVTSYEEHEDIIKQKAPKKYNMSLLSDQQVDLNVEYLKISVNEPLSFSFNIPSKYEAIVE